jgi:hypothetical protein
MMTISLVIDLPDSNACQFMNRFKNSNVRMFNYLSVL